MVIGLIVYVDVLIILNTLINYFILLGVNRITRSDTNRFRILFGAVIGGLSSLLLFLENLGFIVTVLKILSGIFMVIIVFKVKPYKRLLKNIFWLFAISILLGGVVLVFHIFFKTDIMIYSNGIMYFNIDMTSLIIYSVIAYMIITLIARFTDKKAPENKEYYVKLQSVDNIVISKGLMDTGNNLREPFSNYPVILVNSNIFNNLFKDKEKIRFVPVQTINGESLLKAFRPVSMEIGSFKTDKVYVAESKTNLDDYEIILNINLEGEIHNDKN